MRKVLKLKYVKIDGFSKIYSKTNQAHYLTWIKIPKNDHLGYKFKLLSGTLLVLVTTPFVGSIFVVCGLYACDLFFLWEYTQKFITIDVHKTVSLQLILRWRNSLSWIVVYLFVFCSNTSTATVIMVGGGGAQNRNVGMRNKK